jgi:hypothetical protein
MPIVTPPWSLRAALASLAAKLPLVSTAWAAVTSSSIRLSAGETGGCRRPAGLPVPSTGGRAGAGRVRLDLTSVVVAVDPSGLLAAFLPRVAGGAGSPDPSGLTRGFRRAFVVRVDRLVPPRLPLVVVEELEQVGQVGQVGRRGVDRPGFVGAAEVEIAEQSLVAW